MQDARIRVIIKELDGKVIQCSADDWFEAYAPSAQMDPVLLEAILTSLRTMDGHGYTLLGDHYGWLKYHEEKRHGEVEGFRTFEDVIDTIRNVAQEYNPKEYAKPTTIDNASVSISTKSHVTGYRFLEDWILSRVECSEQRPMSGHRMGTRRSSLLSESMEAAKSDKETWNSGVIAGFKLEDDDGARLSVRPFPFLPSIF